MADWIRDPSRSSSELGQMVKETLPRTMFFMDVDGVVYKKATRILRVIEQKQPGQQLKPSQETIFPMFARMIAREIEDGLLDSQSGVFVMVAMAPFESAFVYQIGGAFRQQFDRAMIERFLLGERL